MKLTFWKRAFEEGPKWFAWLSAISWLASALIWLWPKHSPTAGFLGGLGLGFLGIAYVIRKLQNKNPIDETVRGIHADAPHFRDAPIDVGVITRNPDGTEHHTSVELSWATVLKGVQSLCEQMRLLPNWTNIDACIGINPGGLVLADYISKHYAIVVPRERLGVILTHTRQALDKAQGSSRRGVVFPELPENRSGRVLLVDSQLKTGASLTRACDHLKKKYGARKIWYLALIACGVSTDVNSMSLYDRLKTYRVGCDVRMRKLPRSEVFCWVAYITPKEAVTLPERLF